MGTKKEISSSMEDYLETIYLFEEANQKARVGEVAEHLGVKKSSVTEALQNLSRENLVNYIPYSAITLTAAGKSAAEKILRKHNILKDFFSEILALSTEEAAETACKIEHVISDEVASRFGVLHSLIAGAENEDFLKELHKGF